MRCTLLSIIALAPLAAATPRILPTPHYMEPLGSSVSLSATRPLRILAGPEVSAKDPKLELAARFLERQVKRLAPSVPVRFGDRPAPGEAVVYLWNFERDPNPHVALNLLDRETLSNPEHYGQSYVVKSPDPNTLWVVGGSAQGALLGAMSVLQLPEASSAGAVIHAAYIRDYPDFEFRAASDWLLNIEINGWALDRGRGVDGFATLVEEKLDRALRYKVNMVLIDGFGFSLRKRPEFYRPLMLRLNRYARARGIHLYFGGYGASYGMAYEPVVMYEHGQAFKGEVFENRLSYPNGEKYRCMGFPHARKGYDPAVLGSCRSNDALNGLKAAELREFVEAVEPGALYIHHEDFGGFDGTQKAWRERCQRCRQRWPNDSLQAPDGGAGGLAHGYSALVKGVNSVRKPDSGYEAERDCQIILVSPVYVPDSPVAEDWAEALELWRNAGRQLPSIQNVQVCFREVYPQFHGGERWTERFRSVMKNARLPLNIFMFFAGGADNFITDYPLSGAPALNALFRYARGIYNASGEFYQEPMELINAEYSWNTRSTGFYRVPLKNQEAIDLMRRYMFGDGEPKEIFGPGGLYEDVCRRLYGPKAGPIMAQYYRESTSLPEGPASAVAGSRLQRPTSYLPFTWDRAYAIPYHWRHLVQDSLTWGKQIEDETYLTRLKGMNLTRPELHRRLARRWKIVSDLNRRGSGYIEQALAAGPLPESVEDLRFLRTMLGVYQPLAEALAVFHDALHRRLAAGSSDSEVQPLHKSALGLAREAERRAREAFPQPIDPVGGEVGAARKFSRLLVAAVETSAGSGKAFR